MSLPAGFSDDGGLANSELALKLNKSLYSLVQAPRSWFLHLGDQLMDPEIGLKPSEVEPGVFFGNGVIMVCWVDDCLFFGPDEKKLDELIEKIGKKGCPFTKEDTSKDVFTFLGVELNNEGNSVVLSQHNLIKKVLKTTRMENCNPRATPCTLDPLGTNAEGKRIDEEWSYPSVVGMLMYLCANAYPEIQFAVHRCTRFSHAT